MVDLLKQIEAVPATYPEFPHNLSSKTHGVDRAAIWARIESYTAYRFTQRAVVWTIEGMEDDGWTPPLTPLVSHSADKWEGGAWVSVTLPEGPLGLCLPSDGVFRVTAQVGAGPVPKPVFEAFRRLAEYSATIGDERDHAALAQMDSNIGGEIQNSFSRSQTWAAKAIQLSGAADLLRPYRRA